jgi:hypothetical protein
MGACFLPSGRDILTCVFEGLAFDLVLQSPSGTGSRFTNPHQNIASVVESLGDDRVRVCSMIRACKYWAKRQHDLPLKLFMIEGVMVYLWRTKTKKKKPTFKSFLKFLVAKEWSALSGELRPDDEYQEQASTKAATALAYSN